jgi:hypothetical protein
MYFKLYVLVPIETDEKSFHLLSHRTVPKEAGDLDHRAELGSNPNWS